MHFLLPDTALAKATGVPSLHDAVISTVKVFTGAPIFGVGMFVFWLLTPVVLLRVGASAVTTLLANSVFPALFLAAALRGQGIQGYRYFAWTLVFSVLWNILAIGRALPDKPLAG